MTKIIINTHLFLYTHIKKSILSLSHLLKYLKHDLYYFKIEIQQEIKKILKK